LWRPWVLAAAFGVVLLFCGAVAQVMQLVVSIRRRHELRDETGDPWNGRSLEWSTASPPPAFNFAVLPNVQGQEPYWTIKRRAIETQQMAAEPGYKPIHMPKNSPTGSFMAFFASIGGFAMVWHIWWLAGVAGAGVYAIFVWFAWRDVDEYDIPAEEVAAADRARRRARQEWLDANARTGEFA